MRLLNTETLRFEEFGDDLPPRYAVLSHRWEDERVTHSHVENGKQHDLPGWSKIRACCKLARSRNIPYAWIDTCCIDKTSSAELSEAINSMYRWYEHATECYVYLSDVKAPNLSTSAHREQFSKSVWFTRGWTLQELIAPKRVLFWNKLWQYLGSKNTLCSLIQDITSIDADVLSGELKPSQFAVSQRMAWAAHRVTTRIEDRAYSLIGLFNVNMPLLYGEGEKAFKRLQKAIMEDTNDHTIFAWGSKTFAKPVLANTPACFKGLEDMIQLLPFNDMSQGFALSNAGLSIHLLLIPWTMNTYLAPLSCGYPKVSTKSSQNTSRNYSRACLFLQQTSHDNRFVRVAVNGHDLRIMDGDQIAQLKGQFNISTKPVFLSQPSDTSTLTAMQPTFYGFQFIFKHRKLFKTGNIPPAEDALCYHKWRPEMPVFHIQDGKIHAAGIFRLRGFHGGMYMYLGFDSDFAPLCLITTRNPQSSRMKRFSLLPDDFTKMSFNSALEMLDLNWLQEQITEPLKPGGETILAFRGQRSERTIVECRSLSLLLTFERKKSDLLRSDAWHVTIDQLPQRNGTPLDTAEDVTVSTSELNTGSRFTVFPNRQSPLSDRQNWPHTPPQTRSRKSNDDDDDDDEDEDVTVRTFGRPRSSRSMPLFAETRFSDPRFPHSRVAINRKSPP